jgi:hypothetical protein
MADVVSLADARLAPFEDVVATCERLLEMARSGELRGLGYVTLKPGDILGTGWDAAPESNRFVLQAGAAILHARIVNKSLDPE